MKMTHTNRRPVLEDQRNNANQVAMLHRFIPTLARAAYKHGIRLARLSSHLCSRACLRASLAATDVGLAAIRSHCEKSDDDNALRVQEQELLVVSKECFYVLAHVCEALGKHIEVCHCALYRIVGLFPRFNSLSKPHLLHNPYKSIYVLQGHKCLDRIEVYVDE